MAIADVLYKYLPVKYFKAIRKQYYAVNKMMYPPMSEKTFMQLLHNKLEIKRGMVLYIHSSTDKLNISFSAFRLLELLLEAVGEEGTVVFPCWHYIGRAEDFLKQSGAVFNVRRSPTTMGLLPELARRHKKAVRSFHPTASVTAIGRYADELLKEHHLDIYPNGEKSPLYKLITYDSKIIGLGEKVVSLSFVHVVEDIMKSDFPLKTLTGEPLECKVTDTENKQITVKTLVPHINISNRDIPGFFNKYISKTACTSFRYRGSNFFTVNPALLFSEMKTLAAKGKTIYK